MDKRENAKKRLDAFENIDRTRTLNKNNTLSSFNESLTTNPVGKMVGQIQNKSTNSENYNDITYDGYKINSDDEDYDDEVDFSGKFSSEDLDTLNFEREIINAKDRKPYSHELPYRKEKSNDYSKEFNTIGRRELDKINSQITNPYANDFNAQDTSNLSKIDDVSDFYNDSESQKRKVHLRRNVAKNNQNNISHNDDTMMNLNALSDRKPQRRYDEKTSNTSGYKLLAGETLDNNYDLDEIRNTKGANNSRYSHSNPKHNHRNNCEDDNTPRSQRKSDSERREFERLSKSSERERNNIRNIEESRKRLQRRRLENTNMQPAIKGQTINIPKSAVNNIQRDYENSQTNSERHNHNYETSEYDYTQPLKRQPSQREQASNNRREQYDENTPKQNEPKKRSSEMVYKRRFEKARYQVFLVSCISIVVCLIAFGAFFYTLFKFNEIKDKYVTLESDYATLKYAQPEVDALRLEIETLTTERDALLAQSQGNISDDPIVEVDGSKDDDEEAPSNGASKSYVVKSGDNLSKIAEANYGNVSYVENIKLANGLTNDELYVGQTLILP